MATEQSQVKLYWLDGSRAQNIVWLLEELNVQYEVEIFHRDARMQAPEALRKVHPLGKSPVIEVLPPKGSGAESIKLAESGFIVQYLCDRFDNGNRLVPERWKSGEETEAWRRYSYLLHYVEGSLFPVISTSLILSVFKSTNIPFFIRPITSFAASQIAAATVGPDAKKHLGMLEHFLATTPDGGPYICGQFSAVDILLSFALILGEEVFDSIAADGSTIRESYPLVYRYITRLKEEPGYKRSLEKMKDLNGGG